MLWKTIRVGRGLIKIKMMEIFKETLRGKSIIRIGKKSITDTKIEEIKNLVKKKKMIKIKVLQSKTDELDLVIAKILSKTGYNLLDIRGSSFIISIKPIKSLQISKKVRDVINLAKG